MPTPSQSLPKEQHVPLKVTYQGQDTVVDDGATAVIGSDAESTIRIVRPGISRRHAVVSETPSGWTIEDAGSRNGSYRFGQRIDSLVIDTTETVFLGHPTDGEKLVLAPVGAKAPAAPVAETFVLPESPPDKPPSKTKTAPATVAPTNKAATSKPATSKPAPATKTVSSPTADPSAPPPPAMTPDQAAARSRAQRTPREVDLAELTNALRDQINAVKGLTWSVWAMIAVTAALAVMTLFVGILGS
jgi:cell division septation protein DedD